MSWVLFALGVGDQLAGQAEVGVAGGGARRGGLGSYLKVYLVVSAD